VSHGAPTARRLVVVVALLGALGLAGCAGAQADISTAVEAMNANLAATGVTVACPATIVGDDPFTCTLVSLDGERTAKVRLRVGSAGGAKALEVIDEDAFGDRLFEVAGGDDRVKRG